MLRVVKTENGWVRGIPAADPRITAFKGIPFAKPPVGELRWRAPQPAEDWEGIRDCYTFGNIAMQEVPSTSIADSFYTKEWHVDPDVPMGEDCLNLNGYDTLAVVTGQTFNSEGVMFEWTQSRHRPDYFTFQTTAMRHKEKKTAPQEDGGGWEDGI